MYCGYKDWLTSQNNKTIDNYICWIKNIKELNDSKNTRKHLRQCFDVGYYAFYIVKKHDY